MYRNLNATSLGATGRQSELIELVLTYGFQGLDVDAVDMIKRAIAQGLDDVVCFIRSANIKVNGFELPCDLDASDEKFQTSLKALDKRAETAREIGFDRCEVNISPASDELPYHDNFERHRKRLAEVAETLAKHDMKLGVGLLAAPKLRQDRAFQFIHKAEELLTLLKTVGVPTVGLSLDTWNWQVGGGGVDQLDELPVGRIVSVRIADVPEDADLSAIEETQRLLPSESTIEVHAELVKKLVERKYPGPITLQPDPSQLDDAPRDTKVEQCAELIDQIYAAAGLTKHGKPAPVEAES